MKARWQGFGERIKRLNPIWNLATGMQLSSLKDYAHMLGLSVLLEMFYREIENNHNRKKMDLIDIAKSCLDDLPIENKLDINDDVIERFVNGLLWSGQSELQQPFTAKWFDEKEDQIKEQRFRYFVEDRGASQWERGGKTVYQCSDEAKELIFMSREILQELEITIDQLYIEHLLKNGHFNQALSGLDDLMARVKRMIAREIDYQDRMKRDPKVIFQQGVELHAQREQEVKQQFQEEKQRFFQMRSLINRLQNSQEQYEVSEKLEQTRKLHDQLAGQVINNIRLEIDLRYEFPNLFWKQNHISFQKSYFQDWIAAEGLPQPDNMTMILEPLFSPRPDFIYPLDWSWMEQETEMTREEKPENDTPEEDPITYRKREVDWEKIVLLWEPLFVELLEKGEVHLSKLRDLSETLQKKWLEQKEAIDLWLLFHSEPLMISIADLEKEQTDERLLLIQKLHERQERFSRLDGKQIVSAIDPNEPMIEWTGISISPFILRLEQPF
ncbi:hypothetical protein PU629_13410 [Pullulanibacillus sp. KACC 23026]|uniref:hypothetical protein n=1 Tax=Pullulanibacillus sp. KACC 23026 TaxID=3028315 RepID=UPI0023AF4CFE|nr:hypothetical protein [Pullulanibacillus sp. KACC 23026]WEG11166.1 hypothetical protein PU629_13410 [Pullulanibacillus sp. KACC 23026]